MRKLCNRMGALSGGFLRAPQAAVRFIPAGLASSPEAICRNGSFLPNLSLNGTTVPMPDMRPNNPTEEPLAVRTYAFASLPAEEYIRRYRDAERFAGLCRQCGRYGRCWACPPFSFDAEEYLSGFGTAHLIAVRIEPGERLRALCADAGQSEKQGRVLLNEARCELDARLLAMEEAWPGSRAFFAGTCFDCPAGTCTRPSDLPCVRPGKIRPSLEALGFDLGRTAAELLGIELRWSTDGRLPEYFTLISGFFTNHSIDSLSW